MASSLKISYAQIPFNSVSITPSVAADTNNNEWNLVAGPRYQRFFYGSAATSSSTVYDIGTTYASKDSTVDHLVVARADFLQDDGTTDIILASSPDNSTWTNRIGISDLNTETLTGPRANDIVVTGGPPVLGGCQLWLDGTKGVTKDSANLISQWNDQSGVGNHATQSTSSLKPTYTRSDNQENFTTYSQVLSTSTAWDRTSYPVSITDNAATDYLGSSVATLMTATAGSSRHGVTWTNSGARFITIDAGSQWHMDVDLKAGTSSYAWVGTSADSPWHGVSVNLSNGTFNGAGANLANKTITSLGSGWYRVSLTITASAMHTPDCGIWFASAANDTSPPTVVAAGTETLYICRPQARRFGTDAGYIQSDAAPQIAGINGNATVLFDGVTDYLSVSGVGATLSGTDKAYSMFIMCKPLAIPNTQTLITLSKASSSTPYESHRLVGSTVDSAKRDDASTTVNPTVSGVTVASHIYSIVTTGTSLSVYQDGTLLGTNSFDVGATTLDQAFIGVLLRAGTITASTYFRGFIAELIIFDSALGTTDRQTVEAYLTAKWITSPSTTQILESPQVRYWRVTYSGSSQVYRHSKCYFGKFFTFDYDPSYEIDYIPAKDSYWYASSGAAHFVRPSDPIYRITLTATAMSDTNVKSFEDKIARYAHRTPVFLHDIKVPEVLNNVSPIHAWLVDYSVEKVAYNYNQMTMVFEESLG